MYIVGSAADAAGISVGTLDSLKPGCHGTTTAVWDKPIKLAPLGVGFSGHGSTATAMPSKQRFLFFEQIVLVCCFIGGGSVGRVDGMHRSAKAPLISPSSIVDQGCLHNASAVSGKPWFNLHVDTVYRVPTSGTLTSLRRYRHAGFLGIKEAAEVTAFRGLGGMAVTMLAHVLLYMLFSDN
ncbi:uncharacterized protein LOC142574388 [Dermacentor variabilis]|uniref:uncharacterized protein LOC142574388 n=1 Tax=Dermacentor variabilis TaxID=34621 RepID=UPI003F5B2105